MSKNFACICAAALGLGVIFAPAQSDAQTRLFSSPAEATEYLQQFPNGPEAAAATQFLNDLSSDDDEGQKGSYQRQERRKDTRLTVRLATDT